MEAISKKIPRLKGKVVRWIDDKHFVVSIKGREVLGLVGYWHLTDKEEETT